jgi:hypothetical protein
MFVKANIERHLEEFYRRTKRYEKFHKTACSSRGTSLMKKVVLQYDRGLGTPLSNYFKFKYSTDFISLTP